MYIEETEAKFNELGIGQFASVSGRYYAMDRDKRWEMNGTTNSSVKPSL
jgi:2,3-bisphosphoglycerate-independent phosphoglycerate mutase